MKLPLLLLSDIEGLGKKGEVVNARTGYIRNFLLPQGLAIIANDNTLRKQERLRKERVEQGIVDRKESEELAARLISLELEITVKVDPEGHMYGSVSALDLVKLFHEKGFPMERRFIQLPKPIKVTGVHTITLKLKEGVLATCQLKILSELGETPLPIEPPAVAPIEATE